MSGSNLNFEKIPDEIFIEEPFQRRISLPTLWKKIKPQLNQLSEMFWLFSEDASHLENPSLSFWFLYENSPYSGDGFLAILESMQSYLDCIYAIVSKFEINSNVPFTDFYWMLSEDRHPETELFQELNLSDQGSVGFNRAIEGLEASLDNLTYTDDISNMDIIKTVGESKRILELVRKDYIYWENESQNILSDGGVGDGFVTAFIALLVLFGIACMIFGIFASFTGLFFFGASILVAFYFFTADKMMDRDSQMGNSDLLNRGDLMANRLESIVIVPRSNCSISSMEIHNAFGYPRIARKPNYIGFYSKLSKCVNYLAEIQDIISLSSSSIPPISNGYGSPSTGKLVKFKNNSFELFTPPIPRGNTNISTHRYTTVERFKHAATMDELFN